ncbi:hypothetical protein [Deinococcus sonorensis]|uniref:Uncharacterized protein n=2 Tax=Deinococcus sonorensis TaxID=309891 RepID=A0AAU7UB54_9DEIO
MTQKPTDRPQPTSTVSEVKWDRTRLYQNEHGEWCIRLPERRPEHLN